jgi:hypothetical protein
MFTREDFLQLQSAEQLVTMDWSDFEWFSKFFFEFLGYERTYVTGKHGEFDGDGGIDVEMYSNNEKIYVQCKRWNVGFNGTILPLHVVRELGGCLLRDNVKKGIVITTLDLDESCKREAQLMNIELYGLAEIIEKMKLVNPMFDINYQEVREVGWFTMIVHRFWYALFGLAVIFVSLLFVFVLFILIARIAL